MRDYGVIRCRFWTWAREVRLSQNAREMCAYVLTCQHANGLGCFRLPRAYIAEDLGTVPDTVQQTIAELVQVGFLKYDEATGWIWIVNFLDHNPVANPNVGKSLVPFVLAIPKKLPFYGEFLDSLAKAAGRFPDGFVDGLRNGMPNGSANPMPNHEHEHEHEHESSEAEASAGKGRFEPTDTNPKAVLFGSEVRAFVCRLTGKPADAVGRLIGKWCKEFDQDHAALLASLVAAQDDPPGNLIEWIGGIVRSRKNNMPAETYEAAILQREKDPAWAGVQ
jgi:hypothetical protein